MLKGLLGKCKMISQVVKSSLYQHLDVDWAAEMLLLFGGDHRDSRQVGFKTRARPCQSFPAVTFWTQIYIIPVYRIRHLQPKSRWLSTTQASTSGDGFG